MMRLVRRRFFTASGPSHDTFPAAAASSQRSDHKRSKRPISIAADLLEKEGFEIVLEPIDLLEYPLEAVPGVTEAFEIIRAAGSTKIKVLYDFYHEQRGTGI